MLATNPRISGTRNSGTWRTGEGGEHLCGQGDGLFGLGDLLDHLLDIVDVKLPFSTHQDHRLGVGLHQLEGGHVCGQRIPDQGRHHAHLLLLEDRPQGEEDSSHLGQDGLRHLGIGLQKLAGLRGPGPLECQAGLLFRLCLRAGFLE